MSGWLVYVFVKLDAVCTAVGTLLLISSALLFVSLLAILITYSEDEYHSGDQKKMSSQLKLWLKWTKRSVPILGFLLCLWVLIPTSAQFAAIYLVPKITSNQEVAALPSDALKLLKSKLKQWEDSIGEKVDTAISSAKP